MRTYSRADFLRSKAEWEDFGSEWSELRRLASERGMLFPPFGSKHDDRDAENPSQRAIIYRALVDQPTELHRIVNRSRSWGQVVDLIIGMDTRLRSEADDHERDEQWNRKERPTERQALTSLGAIIKRIADSV